jgi:hypothetical protein
VSKSRLKGTEYRLIQRRANTKAGHSMPSSSPIVQDGPISNPPLSTPLPLPFGHCRVILDCLELNHDGARMVPLPNDIPLRLDVGIGHFEYVYGGPMEQERASTFFQELSVEVEIGVPSHRIHVIRATSTRRAQHALVALLNTASDVHVTLNVLHCLLALRQTPTGEFFGCKKV